MFNHTPLIWYVTIIIINNNNNKIIILIIIIVITIIIIIVSLFKKDRPVGNIKNAYNSASWSDMLRALLDPTVSPLDDGTYPVSYTHLDVYKRQV